MTYTVKEIFYTLQGEGAKAGRAAVFCRFSGCNLWSGREEDRSRAVCQFCDTDFVGIGPDGGRFRSAEGACGSDGSMLGADGSSAAQLCLGPSAMRPPTALDEVRRLHRRRATAQLDEHLSRRCTRAGSRWRSRPTEPGRRPRHSTGYASAPRPARRSCRSSGNELKLVYPQERRAAREIRAARIRPFLPPANGRPRDAPSIPSVRSSIACAHPRWRLSIQTHKLVGFASQLERAAGANAQKSSGSLPQRRPQRALRLSLGVVAFSSLIECRR